MMVVKSRKRPAVDALGDLEAADSEPEDYGTAPPAPKRSATASATDDYLSPRSSPRAAACECRPPAAMERIITLSPTPTAVLDKHLNLVTTSKSYKALFNIDLDQCRGRNFLDLVRDMLLPLDPAMAESLIKDAIATRAERRSEPMPGTVSPGFWRLRIVPIFEGDELLYVLTEGHDASDEVRKNREHFAQLSSAETYRILVSTLRDYAIFMLDTSGCIATWNTGAMLLKQYQRQEILGKHFSLFYSDEDRRARKPEKELELALRDGKVEDEGWRVKKDGSRFWANVIIAPVYRDGRLTGFSKVTRDLTERKAAEARLIAAYEEASRLKSDFLANMSHEIRTPMHGMLSALSLLIDTGLSDEQKELVEIIDESGGILLQVINDILDYSKLTSGSFSISHEATNIADIVAAVKRCFRFGASGGPKFEIELDPALPTVCQSDPLRYRQILQNLVSNAIKFTENGYVKIKVVVAHEDHRSYTVRTEVLDTGIGVPPDLENILFTPFTQLDNSATKRYKGTGLGLSICKSLVELMGGTIGFGQNPERAGSMFHFSIQVTKVDAAGATPLDVSPPVVDVKTLAENKHILLVEDNAINQTIMVRLLSTFGFEKVDVAGNGAEALRLVTQKPLSYNLILMDISMPVMDGVTATREIRKLGHQIPIIAMTANALKGDEEAYLAEGMNAYVAKPVDKRVLAEAILRHLG